MWVHFVWLAGWSLSIVTRLTRLGLVGCVTAMSIPPSWLERAEVRSGTSCFSLLADPAVMTHTHTLKSQSAAQHTHTHTDTGTNSWMFLFFFFYLLFFLWKWGNEIKSFLKFKVSLKVCKKWRDTQREKKWIISIQRHAANWISNALARWAYTRPSLFVV